MEPWWRSFRRPTRTTWPGGPGGRGKRRSAGASDPDHREQLRPERRGLPGSPAARIGHQGGGVHLVACQRAGGTGFASALSATKASRSSRPTRGSSPGRRSCRRPTPASTTRGTEGRHRAERRGRPRCDEGSWAQAAQRRRELHHRRPGHRLPGRHRPQRGGHQGRRGGRDEEPRHHRRRLRLRRRLQGRVRS